MLELKFCAGETLNLMLVKSWDVKLALLHSLNFYTYGILLLNLNSFKKDSGSHKTVFDSPVKRKKKRKENHLVSVVLDYFIFGGEYNGLFRVACNFRFVFAHVSGGGGKVKIKKIRKV